MALLSLTVKRLAAEATAGSFMDVPPSPPQSPPASSPLARTLLQALPTTAVTPVLPAKKRRKQERPTLFVERQSDDDCRDPADLQPSDQLRVDDANLFWDDLRPGSATGACGTQRGADLLAPEEPIASARYGSDKENETSPMPAVPAEDDDLGAGYGAMDAAMETSNCLDAVTIPNGVLPVVAAAAVTAVESSAPATPLPVFPRSSMSTMDGLAGVPPSALSHVAGRLGDGAVCSDGEGADEGDGGTPETCPDCRKVFKRRVYLQRHMAREHWSTAKVFKCDKCAYETKHQSNLLVHRRTHTGERPYHCGACGQRYTQGHLLKAHIRSRHGAEMAYYNMDKRTDGVRCRRSTASSLRLDQAATNGGVGMFGGKEDKIRFLLEAAEAARHHPGTQGNLPTSIGSFGGGLSLGQYVGALSACLPGGVGNMRPLLWPPNLSLAAGGGLIGSQPAFQLPPPHDNMTSHAALLSSLAATPLPPVKTQHDLDVKPLRLAAPADTSLLSSMLASFATGGNLFTLDKMAVANGPNGPLSVKMEKPSVLSSGGDDGSIPQNLTTNNRGWRNDECQDGSAAAEMSTDMGFLANKLLSTPNHAFARRMSPLGSVPDSPKCKQATSGQNPASPTNTSAQMRSSPWAEKLSDHAGSPMQYNSAAIKEEAEEATDLSSYARGAKLASESASGRASSRCGSGTGMELDLSCRGRDAGSGNNRLGNTPSGIGKELRWVSGAAGSCASECTDPAGCPHLRKLKNLRRNVYRMLSVFTPYLDVAGAGVSDLEADAVDDFLHEVIYSSKLDSS